MGPIAPAACISVLTEFREWVHDKFENDSMLKDPLSLTSSSLTNFQLDVDQLEWNDDIPQNHTSKVKYEIPSPRTLKFISESSSAKLRVENLHYDLTEDDLDVRRLRDFGMQPKTYIYTGSLQSHRPSPETLPYI